MVAGLVRLLVTFESRSTCDPALLSQAIVLGVHEVVLGHCLHLLLAPDPPGHNGEATNEYRATDATNNASNDLLARCRQRAAARTSVSEGGRNGSGYVASRAGDHLFCGNE